MQTLMEKLQILADSAKYDVSCSSSGSHRKNTGNIGNAHTAGICHSWSADGRCISLLKVLFSNSVSITANTVSIGAAMISRGRLSSRTNWRD